MPPDNRRIIAEEFDTFRPEAEMTIAEKFRTSSEHDVKVRIAESDGLGGGF